MSRTKPLETAVPPDVDSVAECPYCGQPFKSGAARDLHVGEDHSDVCSDEERLTYEEVADAEDEQMFYFHMKIGFALGLTHAVLILAYLIVLG